jgi:hypothetical protein
MPDQDLVELAAAVETAARVLRRLASIFDDDPAATVDRVPRPAALAAPVNGRGSSRYAQVLEFVREQQAGARVKEIAAATGMSETYVGNLCARGVVAGELQKVKRGVYRATG